MEDGLLLLDWQRPKEEVMPPRSSVKAEWPMNSYTSNGARPPAGAMWGGERGEEEEFSICQCLLLFYSVQIYFKKKRYRGGWKEG